MSIIYHFRHVHSVANIVHSYRHQAD
jgi:hypothetical protein